MWVTRVRCQPTSFPWAYQPCRATPQSKQWELREGRWSIYQDVLGLLRLRNSLLPFQNCT